MVVEKVSDVIRGRKLLAADAVPVFVNYLHQA